MEKSNLEEKDFHVKFLLWIISWFFLLLIIFIICFIFLLLYQNNTEVLWLLLNNSNFHFLFLWLVILATMTFWFSYYDIFLRKIIEHYISKDELIDLIKKQIIESSVVKEYVIQEVDNLHKMDNESVNMNNNEIPDWSITSKSKQIKWEDKIDTDNTNNSLDKNDNLRGNYFRIIQKLIKLPDNCSWYDRIGKESWRIENYIIRNLEKQIVNFSRRNTWFVIYFRFNDDKITKKEDFLKKYNRGNQLLPLIENFNYGGKKDDYNSHFQWWEIKMRFTQDNMVEFTWKWWNNSIKFDLNNNDLWIDLLQEIIDIVIENNQVRKSMYWAM